MADLDSITIAPEYDPREDKGEFMNPTMLAYFKRELLKWRSDLLKGSSDTVAKTLQSTELQKPDLTDRASEETDHALELRTRDRERKLINKINKALKRIDDEDYGYCEETGEEIGLGRLEARPTATLTVDAQERREMFQKQFRDDR